MAANAALFHSPGPKEQINRDGQSLLFSAVALLAFPAFTAAPFSGNRMTATYYNRKKNFKLIKRYYAVFSGDVRKGCGVYPARDRCQSLTG
jgi:hypothetical protein